MRRIQEKTEEDLLGGERDLVLMNVLVPASPHPLQCRLASGGKAGLESCLLLGIPCSCSLKETLQRGVVTEPLAVNGRLGRWMAEDVVICLKTP